MYHQMGRKQQNKSRPCTICCFKKKFKKETILANANKLRNTRISIYKGFSKDTMELVKTFWEDVLEYHRQNKFACLFFLFIYCYRNFIIILILYYY